MNRKLGALVLLLAGGATGQEIPTPGEAMTTIRSNLIGREIGEAFVIYGPPDGQTTIKGHTVYLWRHARSVEWSRPQQVTTRGQVGDGSVYPYSQPVPYVEYSTVQGWATESYSCTLAVGIDANGVIDEAGINGKMGACQDFVR